MKGQRSLRACWAWKRDGELQRQARCTLCERNTSTLRPPARPSLHASTHDNNAQVARARASAYGSVVRVRIAPHGTDGAVQLGLSYTAVEDLVRFAAASIHYMPLPSNSYDLVYGQDPDGLANEHRIHAFK